MTHRCSRCGALITTRHDHNPRPSASRRGYNSAWQKIRAEHLRIQPACVDCGAMATDVDHIISKRRGGTNDHTNLASRCHACHSRKTVRVDGGFGNARRVESLAFLQQPDGWTAPLSVSQVRQVQIRPRENS